MINLSSQNTPKPQLSPAVRVIGFPEISTGYTEEMAVREAMRCLRCKDHPCMDGCPLHNRIPEFIEKVTEGKFEEAYAILRDRTPMPEICSRVCPQESQCEGHCIRGVRGKPVNIGLLERFVADYHAKHQNEQAQPAAESNSHKVAVIGAGPAGIACAGALADKGYDVSILDAGEAPGGVLRYGIPSYRLPLELVENKVASMKQKGVRFVSGKALDAELNADVLLTNEGYEAVFLGTGADMPTLMKIPGMDAKSVVAAHTFLAEVNRLQKEQGADLGETLLDKTVTVIGAGNVAMDAARSALRMGAKSVRIVYRRGMEEMPARRDEIREALEEGIALQLLTQPVQIRTDASGSVNALVCEQLRLGEPDASGRRQPESLPNSSFELETDMVILALGSKPDPKLSSAVKELKFSERGTVLTDENGATSRPGVFAGGDAVTGPANVSRAVSAGLRAADSIDAYLTSKA